MGIKGRQIIMLKETFQLVLFLTYFGNEIILYTGKSPYQA